MESYEEKDTKVHIPEPKKFKIIFNLCWHIGLLRKTKKIFSMIGGYNQ